MTSGGEFTRAEILSQPKVWAETLSSLDSKAMSDFYQGGKFDSVILTGCGSTYYLSLATASIFQRLASVASLGLPASEIWLYSDSAYTSRQRQLLIAVSRSGETTETVRAVEAFKKRGHGTVATFTCYPDSTLARQGDFNILLTAAQERSVAQTRAFSALMLALTFFAVASAGRDDLIDQMAKLPDACERLLSQYGSLAHDYGTDPRYDRFYILGSGVRYGLAAELSLKMKEMSLSHSEPFHFMEFRHGPISMVTETSLIVGLVSDQGAAQERAVLNDVQAKGAKAFMIAESDASVAFESGIDESIRDVLYLPFGQLLAFEHALSKGLNPDQPHNLTAVVRLS